MIDDNETHTDMSKTEKIELTPEMKMAIEVGIAELGNHDGWVEHMESDEEVEDVYKGIEELRKEFYG